MTTISVPVPPHLEEFITTLAKHRGSNKAAVVRSALERLVEEEAMQAMLRAETEPTLKGDLRDLAKKCNAGVQRVWTFTTSRHLCDNSNDSTHDYKKRCPKRKDIALQREKQPLSSKSTQT